MNGAFVFADPQIGVRFSADDRFVVGPAMAPTQDAGLGDFRSAYLAFTAEGGRQYVLSISSVAVSHSMTLEEREARLPAQNAHNAELAAGRDWLLSTPVEIGTVAGRPATRNEFVTAGTHPDDRATDDEDEDASGHVQARAVFPEGRTVSLTLGVYPPGDLDEARAIMETVFGSLELSAPAG